MIVILMGVSGSGKTTVGRLLAGDLGWPFYDGDDWHPPANRDKMSRGIALTDADRDIWLTALQHFMSKLIHDGQSAVIACSALKQAYRDRLQVDKQLVRFIYLRGSYDLIRQRLQERRGHFMPADLLTSQFETLEEPQDVVKIDIANEPEAIVSLIKQNLGL